MILREALRSATQTLLGANVSDATVEAELLLGHVLRMSKTQLHTEPERDLTPAETKHLWGVVRRRLDREPAAYILGHWEFYGIDLYVERDTFIPRPETEILVEKALELARLVSRREKQITIADIGTGCGAIAVSLALALPQARIYATDISAASLRVAEKNCQRHAVCGRVELLLGDLLEPLPDPVDMIVANLPYIKDREFEDLSPEIVDFEPMIALAGGEKGLDRIQELLEQMPGKLNRGGCFLLEIGQGQGGPATSLIDAYFPRAGVELIPDLGGIDRVVKVALTALERG
ncbi:MAG: peptide chain release factor N(5)-glutamine methyltransferase [Dehalococcoidia bacterium]